MSLTQERATDTPETEYLPFCLPLIGEEEIAAVVECLRSGWITTGPRTKQFETEFAEFIGAKYAVALNSCTAALHLALEALGLRAGEEVLVPTVTFAATAEVVRYLDARPVLIDCDPHTLNIDLNAVRAYLEEQCSPGDDGLYNRATGARVRAIIPVHYAGLPCPMEPLMELARQYNLRVVEDTAHAFPAYIRGRAAGTFGDIGAFSFYATKTITTGEGGMLTTDDEELAQRARLMSLHGISRDAWLRYTAQGSWYYEILEPGYKYNLTDIASALGLEQLRRANELWQVRSAYARRYSEAFRDLPELEVPAEAPPGYEHAWHLYVVQLNLDRLKIDRAEFIEEFRRRQIGTSVHFIPLHLHPYYRDTYGYRPEHLPVASAVYPRLLTLPLYPKMTEGDVERVIRAVREVVDAHRR